MIWYFAVTFLMLATVMSVEQTLTAVGRRQVVWSWVTVVICLLMLILAVRGPERY